MKIRRRDFFPLAGAGLLAGYAGWEGARSRRNSPAGPSPVVVVKASSYSDDLAQRILQGVRECGLDVRDQKVLLKPNFVPTSHLGIPYFYIRM